MGGLRIPPPLVALFSAGLIYVIARFNIGPHFSFRPLNIIALAFAITGLSLDVMSVLDFWKSKTTINPLSANKTSALVTTGMNRISRNPMYLGMLLVLIGIALFSGYIAAIAPLIFFVFYITYFQIIPEEADLSKIFGSEYDNYKRRVRRWI